MLRVAPGRLHRAFGLRWVAFGSCCPKLRTEGSYGFVWCFTSRKRTAEILGERNNPPVVSPIPSVTPSDDESWAYLFIFTQVIAKSCSQSSTTSICWRTQSPLVITRFKEPKKSRALTGADHFYTILHTDLCKITCSE